MPPRERGGTLAEELALCKIPAAAYHAGLDPETRERVQTAFQAGELEVVVATIAFGMGIDKADIRTVIHAGLPATLEGYYQEIGRAGRDGALSRTYLMHSYADQRTHDFFLNRDYPPADHLQQVFKRWAKEPQRWKSCAPASKLGEEEFDKALEKLEIHGGARVDFGGNVTMGGTGWKKTYTVQAQFRAEQFEKVLRFTTSTECRMAALVRHFGDEEDASRTCGICDVCDPAGAVLRLFRRPTANERALVQAIVDELRTVDYKATGTLQRNLDPAGRMSRNEFDALLDAMVRAGLIEIEEAEFEKDGEVDPLPQGAADRSWFGNAGNPAGRVADQRWSGEGVWRSYCSGAVEEDKSNRKDRLIEGDEQEGGGDRARTIVSGGKSSGGADQGVARGGGKTAGSSGLPDSARPISYGHRTSASGQPEAITGD
jgi:hypothetical protein